MKEDTSPTKENFYRVFSRAGSKSHFYAHTAMRPTIYELFGQAKRGEKKGKAEIFPLGETIFFFLKLPALNFFISFFWNASEVILVFF